MRLTIFAARNPDYYEQAEFARDDYYAERGAVGGVWLGEGATLLGLAGSIGVGDLGVLLEGRNPATGASLGGLRAVSVNAGFDLTWAAPKSVSVLLGVADERTRRVILGAHEEAVQAGVAWLEQHACFVRRGSAAGGTLRVERAAGLVGGLYTHELSRAGDPHLHSHGVVANRALGSDGRWTALDMRSVYREAKTAGMVAAAVERRLLAERLGVEWVERSRGVFELAGIPAAVLGEFSRRRVEILEVAAARGVSEREHGRIDGLQRATRDHKPLLDRGEVVADWRARSAEHGLGRAEQAQVAGRGGARAVSAAEALVIAARLGSVEGLTARASTFSRREVVQGFCEQLVGGASVAELERHAGDWQRTHAIEVAPAQSGVPARLSTRALLGVERRLLELAPQPAGVGVDGALVDAVVSRQASIGDDQAGVVRHLLDADGRRVRCVEAGPGRGKTFSLRVVREACAEAGVPIIGCAWQGSAAELLGEAGVEAMTLARLLSRERAGHAVVPERGVVLVDEAGVVPTRQLAALVELAAHRGAVVALVGDRNQPGAIGAGGAFEALSDRLGAAWLTENRRQQDPAERRVEQLLSAQQPREAVRLLRDSGRLHTAVTFDEARERLLDGWKQSGGVDEPAAVLMLAHDNRDVRLLNDAARAERQQAGQLGADELEAGGRVFAVGDRVVCRKNAYALGVRNGTLATITRLDNSTGTIELAPDTAPDQRRALSAEYVREHLQHGYAITGHLAQGHTVRCAHVLAQPERPGAEWALLVATRQTERVDLYSATDTDPELLAASLAEAWAISTRDQLATRQLEQSHTRALDHTHQGAAAARNSIREARSALDAARRAQQPYTARLARLRDAADARDLEHQAVVLLDQAYSTATGNGQRRIKDTHDQLSTAAAPATRTAAGALLAELAAQHAPRGLRATTSRLTGSDPLADAIADERDRRSDEAAAARERAQTAAREARPYRDQTTSAERTVNNATQHLSQAERAARALDQQHRRLLAIADADARRDLKPMMTPPPRRVADQSREPATLPMADPYANPGDPYGNLHCERESQPPRRPRLPEPSSPSRRGRGIDRGIDFGW